MTRAHRTAVSLAAGLLTLVLVIRALDPPEPTKPQESDPAPSVAEGPGPWAHPDAGTLAVWSEGAGVPVFYTYAIAWRETRNNAAPGVRGKAGEIGRFQILPSTARLRCKGIDVREYYGNLACFVKMAREDGRKCGGDWRCAAHIHNGAYAYADSVMIDIQTLVGRRIGQ